MGIGGAVQTGYLYALRNEYDIAIQMDGDGQHDPAFLDALIAPLEKNEADICIGSRFLDDDVGFKSSRTRRAGIRFLSCLIFLCTKKHFKDVTSGFRAVNRKYIELYAKNYPLDYPEPEAIVMAVRSGAVIKEIPVKMRDRAKGVSSIDLKKSVYYMVKVSLSLVLANVVGKRGDFNL